MINLFKGLISASKGLSDTFGSFNLIADKTWFLISSTSEEKVNYIFRSKNDELLVSQNGNIKKGKWELIKTSNCLLIEFNGQTNLYHILYLRENYFIFKNEFDPFEYVFVNESFYQTKYLKMGEKVLDQVLNDIRDKSLFDLKPQINEVNPEYFKSLDSNIDKIDEIIAKLKRK